MGFGQRPSSRQRRRRQSNLAGWQIDSSSVAGRAWPAQALAASPPHVPNMRSLCVSSSAMVGSSRFRLRAVDSSELGTENRSLARDQAPTRGLTTCVQGRPDQGGDGPTLVRRRSSAQAAACMRGSWRGALLPMSQRRRTASAPSTRRTHDNRLRWRGWRTWSSGVDQHEEANLLCAFEKTKKRGRQIRAFAPQSSDRWREDKEEESDR